MTDQVTDFDLAEIAALRDTDPDKYQDFIRQLARQKLPAEALAVVVQADESQVSFEAFYEGIHNEPIAEHNNAATDKAFKAFEDGEPFLYLGFRGCRKTTTYVITLAAWLHGKHPEGTGLITGAGDKNATILARAVSLIIEYTPFFKQCFPHVIPKDKAWGAEGYWLIDTRVTREEWEAQQAKTPDPSFIGGGYKSASINGKHPTLYLFPDDLHDIDSSASKTERDYIKLVWNTQILKTVVRKNDKLVTRILLTGVPFAKDDAYQEMIDTGSCSYIKLPVMRKASQGDKGAVYIDGRHPKTGVVLEDIVGWWILTWPKEFGVKSIVLERAKSKSAFWQMYMLDIAIAKTSGLRYYSYDHTKIGFDLPTVGGADPTSFDMDTEVGGKKRSHFALAYLCKLPEGGAVVKDIFLKQCSILDAKESILRAQSMFSNWRTTGIEDVGPGKVFKNYVKTDPRVRFVESSIADPKGRVRDKEARFEGEIGPWLENMVIRISDEDTEGLNALRRLCDNFFDIGEHDSGKDAGDALYHAAKLLPEVLRQPTPTNLNPVAMMSRGGLSHPMAGGMYGRN